MAHAINLEGKKFGRLKVLSRSIEKGNRRQVKWDCICDCGSKHLVTGESLRSGKSKSCGCLLRESRYIKNKNIDRKKAMLKLLYSPLKKRHRKKFKNENYIDFEEFCKLSLSNCYYCGVKPTHKQEDIRYETRYGKHEKIKISDYVLSHNGVDRINSSKGYEKGNVVPCCRKCNVAKLDMNIQNFKKHIKNIYKYWASK